MSNLPEDQRGKRVNEKPAIPEVDFERVAEAIRRTGDLATRMQRAGLARQAIVILLHDATGVGKPAIRSVLDALPKLPDWCLTKKAAKP